eukprot:XP_019072542.1 PREDICTED: probable leucine-rich repeat receptor-like serine/threonine-protein kinase At3g14840 [Vitis vinifera]
MAFFSSSSVIQALGLHVITLTVPIFENQINQIFVCNCIIFGLSILRQLPTLVIFSCVLILFFLLLFFLLHFLNYSQLKGLNLTGVLPAEFGSLKYLQELDLTRNYFNGSIPTSFSRLPLVNLSLLGNRLSGSIPKEIGDIATLEELILEDNQLEGPLNENLGNLGRLRRLVLKAQSLPGTVPKELVKLPYLQEIDLTRNYLYGSIPEEWGSTKLVNMYA